MVDRARVLGTAQRHVAVAEGALSALVSRPARDILPVNPQGALGFAAGVVQPRQGPIHILIGAARGHSLFVRGNRRGRHAQRPIGMPQRAVLRRLRRSVHTGRTGIDPSRDEDQARHGDPAPRPRQRHELPGPAHGKEQEHGDQHHARLSLGTVEHGAERAGGNQQQREHRTSLPSRQGQPHAQERERQHHAKGKREAPFPQQGRQDG